MSCVRTISLGQRSRSQSTLTVCALTSPVQPLILSCMVGFKNDLVQMIINPRQCVLFKNHGAMSMVRFTICTYSGIGVNETYLCPAHNFVVGPASGMVRYKDLVFPCVCTIPSRCYLTQGTRRGNQCPMGTFLF